MNEASQSSPASRTSSGRTWPTQIHSQKFSQTLSQTLSQTFSPILSEFPTSTKTTSNLEVSETYTKYLVKK